ncbi:hypothetical protein [Paludisphaera rhizosphaerae]|uniref:hypothetical protein n=1 Tax=Paludisphaera rhizosphaerae TaxID=2711216 RepID=UPI0013EDFA2B|nr:hypothetical protein [Paludisphaera rhizosphaerae]
MSANPAVRSTSQAALARNPLKSPSYPSRTHFGEMPALAGRLKSLDERLGAVKRKLSLLSNHARRGEYEKLVVQMQGARDQFVDASYRMPREAGGLYHEDLERLEAAERSFAWLQRRWDAVTA